MLPKTKSKRDERREAKEKSAWEAKRKAVAAGRADAKLTHVIINEKKDKKSFKYLVPKLPWPYTSVEQYEKEMRAPVGTEWNTSQAHSQMIRPAVCLSLPASLLSVIHF
jgi:U3 small nucleolar RNA-associated protein 14